MMDYYFRPTLGFVFHRPRASPLPRTRTAVATLVVEASRCHATPLKWCLPLSLGVYTSARRPS
jgi:hypothetical protein